MSFWRKIKLASLIIANVSNTIRTYSWWGVWINAPETFHPDPLILTDIWLSCLIVVGSILIAWADKAEVEEKGNNEP